MLSAFGSLSLWIANLQDTRTQSTKRCCLLLLTEQWKKVNWLPDVLPSHVKIVQCSLKCFRLLTYSLFIDDQNFETKIFNSDLILLSYRKYLHDFSTMTKHKKSKKVHIVNTLYSNISGSPTKVCDAAEGQDSGGGGGRNSVLRCKRQRSTGTGSECNMAQGWCYDRHGVSNFIVIAARVALVWKCALNFGRKC